MVGGARLALGLPLLGVLALFVLSGPIAQPADYHRFADTRAWLGVPRVGDVLSSFAFLLVGAAGLVVLRGRGAANEVARLGWPLFFWALIATAIGSAYYHWAPDDARLVWDRVPMAVAFASLVVLLIGERVAARAAALALTPAVLVALGSVAWWAGSGDLRAYLAVQGYAVLVLPLLLWLVPDPQGRPAWPWWCLLAGYLLAKGAELADAPLYAVLGVSGHTLKHLLAAAGIAALVLRLERQDG